MFPPRAPFFSRGGNHVSPTSPLLQGLFERHSLRLARARSREALEQLWLRSLAVLRFRNFPDLLRPALARCERQARDHQRRCEDADAPPQAAEVVVPAEQAVDREAAGAG